MYKSKNLFLKFAIQISHSVINRTYVYLIIIFISNVCQNINKMLMRLIEQPPYF